MDESTQSCAVSCVADVLLETRYWRPVHGHDRSLEDLIAPKIVSFDRFLPVPHCAHGLSHLNLWQRNEDLRHCLKTIVCQHKISEFSQAIDDNLQVTSKVIIESHFWPFRDPEIDANLARD